MSYVSRFTLPAAKTNDRFQKALRRHGIEVTSPCTLPRFREGWRYWRRRTRNEGIRHGMRPDSPQLKTPIPDETARLFHVALHDVVRSSAISMAELRECVNACVCFLRQNDVG